MRKKPNPCPRHAATRQTPLKAAEVICQAFNHLSTFTFSPNQPPPHTLHATLTLAYLSAARSPFSIRVHAPPPNLPSPSPRPRNLAISGPAALLPVGRAFPPNFYQQNNNRKTLTSGSSPWSSGPEKLPSTLIRPGRPYQPKRRRREATAPREEEPRSARCAIRGFVRGRVLLRLCT